MGVDEWKEAFLAREGLVTALREENARLRSELDSRPVAVGSVTGSSVEVEAAIIEYSFGNDQLASRTRTLAVQMLAAKVPVDQVVEQIRAGRTL